MIHTVDHKMYDHLRNIELDVGNTCQVQDWGGQTLKVGDLVRSLYGNYRISRIISIGDGKEPLPKFIENKYRKLSREGDNIPSLGGYVSIWHYWGYSVYRDDWGWGWDETKSLAYYGEFEPIDVKIPQDPRFKSLFI